MVEEYPTELARSISRLIVILGRRLGVPDSVTGEDEQSIVERIERNPILSI